MTYLDGKFYDGWADKQINDERREVILKWKAVNLANLIFRSLGTSSFHSICEIGGAEGIVLNTLGELIRADELINYEISSKFCDIGKSLYPKIQFKNVAFESETTFYNAIVLSDIIEHVEDDDLFLRTVSKRCSFVILKIPIEKCISQWDLFYWLKGTRKPANEQFGASHYNGHLRGYTVSQAKQLVSRYFEILDDSHSDVDYFYSTPMSKFIKKTLGTSFTVLFYGGALFVLGKTKDSKQQ